MKVSKEHFKEKEKLVKGPDIALTPGQTGRHRRSYDNFDFDIDLTSQFIRCLHYEDGPVNVVHENKHCLYLESYESNEYIMWVKRRISFNVEAGGTNEL
jgi:hypothetical protein